MGLMGFLPYVIVVTSKFNIPEFTREGFTKDPDFYVIAYGNVERKVRIHI